MQARHTPATLVARLRATYWFVPALLTGGAVGLAIGAVSLDRVRPDLSGAFQWIYGGSASGGQALLSSVAGSTVTVVSVTFSVTIVALTVSAQHFGPRLLSSFMRDTSVQVVLGILIGTYAYCLIVLGSVEGSVDTAASFVPHLAITGGLLLALLSVAALIYYVHHVSASMKISRLAANVARDLTSAIAQLYPAEIGGEPPQPVDVPPAVPQNAEMLTAAESGYVQQQDADGLVRAASDHDVMVWVLARPGDFVVEGTPIAAVHPRPGDSGALRRDLNRAYVFGPDRTIDQDAAFAIQQLVEIALHGLSPGMNEPFTTLTCLDRLGEGLARLASRNIPAPVRSDDQGRPRVVSRSSTFADLLNAALQPIRLAGSRHLAIVVGMLDTIERLSHLVRREGDREALRHEAIATRNAAMDELQLEEARTEVERRFLRVERRLGLVPPRP